MITLHRQRVSTRSGFTLIELLVSIGGIVILLALTFPLLQQMRKESENSKCISNIRACGMALLLHAGNNQYELALPWGGDESTLTNPAFQERYPNLASHPQFKKNWCDYLYSAGYLSSMDVVYCPSQMPRSRFSAPNKLPWGFAYGMRRYASISTQYAPMRVVSQGRTSNFVLLGDSIRSDSLQWYYTHHPAGASNNQFHFRHKGRSNFFFLDGSVRSLSPQELVDLGDGWQMGVANTTPPVGQ